MTETTLIVRHRLFDATNPQGENFDHPAEQDCPWCASARDATREIDERPYCCRTHPEGMCSTCTEEARAEEPGPGTYEDHLREQGLIQPCDRCGEALDMDEAIILGPDYAALDGRIHDTIAVHEGCVLPDDEPA